MNRSRVDFAQGVTLLRAELENRQLRWLKIQQKTFSQPVPLAVKLWKKT